MRLTSAWVGLARRAALPDALALGPEPLEVAWCRGDRGVFVAGVGRCGLGPGTVRWLDGGPPDGLRSPWFGGWAFDAERPWAGFPAEGWLLPEVVAWGPPGHVWIAAFGPEGTPRATLDARLDAVRPVGAAGGPNPVALTSSGRGGWDALVTGALCAIAAGELEKVVVARAVDLRGASPFEPRAVLGRLLRSHPECWVFLLRGVDGAVLIGGSPETLCEARGRELWTEALAGTAAAGATGLRGSDKDGREHRFVVDGIIATLGPFADAVGTVDAAGGPRTKRQGRLLHLHTPIRARLRPGVPAVAAARAMHPTPALAGTPTDAARRWLRSGEGFARGWYGGAFGVVGDDELTLAVVIRCALLRGEQARLFVGAGIVAGSTPDDEWAETELKATVMRSALEGADD